MNSARSHVHAGRTYYGEDTAQPLLEWLNAPEKKSDQVEKMLLAFKDLESRTREFDAVRTIRSILRKSELRLKPFWRQPMVTSRTESSVRPGVYLRKLDRSRSVIEWDPVSSRMNVLEAGAMHKLLTLASQGLANRVRKCARRECGTWFYARFAHQECCSIRCQQSRVRSTDEWKKKRSEYMRRHRHDEKMRAQKEFEKIKSKRKAGKR